MLRLWHKVICDAMGAAARRSPSFHVSEYWGRFLTVAGVLK